MHPIIEENWHSMPEELREKVVDKLVCYLSMSGVCPVPPKVKCEYRNEDEFCQNKDVACRCWMGVAAAKAFSELKEEEKEKCLQTDSTQE